MEGGAFSFDGGVSQTKHVKLGAGDESRKITKVILGHGILSVNTEKKQVLTCWLLELIVLQATKAYTKTVMVIPTLSYFVDLRSMLL